MVLFLMLLKRINCRHSVMICLPADKTMRKSTTRSVFQVSCSMGKVSSLIYVFMRLVAE